MEGGNKLTDEALQIACLEFAGGFEVTIVRVAVRGSSPIDDDIRSKWLLVDYVQL